jgi:hypothetical protein
MPAGVKELWSFGPDSSFTLDAEGPHGNKHYTGAYRFGRGNRVFVENISPLLGGQHGMEADITIEGDQITAQDGNSVTTFRRAGLP